MFKEFVKSIAKLSLLIFVFHISLKALEESLPSIDFDSYLQPKDHALLDQDEPMVYMPLDFINIMKNITSDVQAVKELIDYIKVGYCIAPLKDVSLGIEQMLKSFDLDNEKYAIIKNYQQALLNGDAIVRTEEIINRRGRCGKFCNLFVQDCASIGHLNVRCNINALGTISASNFIFTGITGCMPTAKLPSISSCGNIAFNTWGTNSLQAQGALESLLGLIRATVSLGTPGITLIPTMLNPGTAITVGILTPSSAFINAGSGLSTGDITGNAFSSSMVGVTPNAGVLEYYFVVNLHIPLTFGLSYSAIPTISSSMGSMNPPVMLETPFADDNSFTTTNIFLSNVTSMGATLNVGFNIIAQGASYAEASNNAALAINNIISNPVNAFYVNLIVDGPV